MSVKPIDLQVHIAQITEVARGEHARHSAILEQQQVLEKESKEKTNLQKERVEENKKADNTAIRDKEKESGRGQQGWEQRKGKDTGTGSQEDQQSGYDEKIGRIIDIRK